MACWLNAPSSPWNAILIFLVCIGLARFALLLVGLLRVIAFLPTHAHPAPAFPPMPSLDPRYAPRCRLPFAAEDKKRAWAAPGSHPFRPARPWNASGPDATAILEPSAL